MKRLVSIVLAVFLLAAAAGCGGGEKKNGEFKPSLDTKIAGTVRVAGHYSNFEALEAEFNAFQKLYPNVDLTYTYLDNYNKIIATTLASSDAPDIFFTYPWMAGSEILTDYAENLADKSLGIDLGCIRADSLYKDVVDDAPTAPIYTTTYGMMVNEDIFAKEKIAVPKTYDELVAACEALKKAGYASPMLGYNRGNFLIYPMYFPYFCASVMGNTEALAALNELNPSAGEYMRGALELAADFMSHGFIDLQMAEELENDYQDVIMRFFQGDIPMMLASGNTVSGTEKRESQSEAFKAHPFTYSFRPVPSTAEGGYFLNTVSMEFAVNKNSANLALANEFMRFLICTKELNRMAEAKRMVTPCTDMSLDKIYASFGEIDAKRIINTAKLGLQDAPDAQVRRAGWQVSNGLMTVDEAIAAFGHLE